MADVLNAPGLPEYTETPDVPGYTVNPLPNEQSLALSGRIRRPQEYVKQTKNGGVVLALNARQEEEATGHPMYGRNELIEGIVTIKEWENAALAQVKIEGKMRLEIYTSFSGPWEGGFDAVLTSHIIDLWSQDTVNPGPPPPLHFSFRQPVTFEREGTLANLPPSFFITFPGLLGLTASITYTISVQIPHIKKKGLLPSGTTLTTQYTYYPRARPQQPTLRPPLSRFSNVGALPDHWVTFDCSLVARARKIQPINCKFILPTIRTFAVESTIPFHVQLASSTSSQSIFRAQEGIGSSRLNSLFRFSNTPGPRPVAGSEKSGDKKKPYKPIRVSLLRQVIVEVHGQSMTQSRVFGEGKLKSVGDIGGFLTWEGEVTPSKDLTVGSFKALGLTVKDFMVLNVDAPNSDLSPLQFAVPVRYVTDPFEAGSAVDTPGSE